MGNLMLVQLGSGYLASHSGFCMIFLVWVYSFNESIGVFVW